MQVHQQVLQQSSTSDNVKYIIDRYDWKANLNGDYKDWMYSRLKYFVQQPDGAETEELVLDKLLHYAEMHKLPHVTPLQESVDNCLSTPNITIQ